jgi:hypothetical protein
MLCLPPADNRLSSGPRPWRLSKVPYLPELDERVVVTVEGPVKRLNAAGAHVEHARARIAKLGVHPEEKHARWPPGKSRRVIRLYGSFSTRSTRSTTLHPWKGLTATYSLHPYPPMTARVASRKRIKPEARSRPSYEGHQDEGWTTSLVGPGRGGALEYLPERREKLNFSWGGERGLPSGSLLGSRQRDPSASDGGASHREKARKHRPNLYLSNARGTTWRLQPPCRLP